MRKYIWIHFIKTEKVHICLNSNYWRLKKNKDFKIKLFYNYFKRDFWLAQVFEGGAQIQSLYS